jgi:hypothetical protein
MYIGDITGKLRHVEIKKIAKYMPFLPSPRGHYC